MSDVVPATDVTRMVLRGSTPQEKSPQNAAEQLPRLLAGLVPPSGDPSGLHQLPPAGDARFWLAAIAESSGDAIIGKDLNGIVTSWNKAAEAMFGYAAAEIVGQSITGIIPPDRMNEEASILEQLRRGEKIVHFETQRKRRDGAIFPVSLSISPIRDDQDNIIGVSKIARDLTERDRREATLRAANVELTRLAQQLAKERDNARQASLAKSRFLAATSDGLRTPLDVIIDYAQLLRSGGRLDDTQEERVEGMLTAARHLLQMITGVHDLTEIEADRIEVQSIECDIQAIATSCLDLVRPSAEAKGLALSITMNPGTPRQVITDPVRFRQVLFSLLGNAFKSTSQGSINLRLRTSADCSALRIEVIDTGPSIVADQRQNLFQDFGRLDPSEPGEGVGIGLALTARLARLMGGCLGHDDNPAGGSVFWLELPLNTAVERASPAGPGAAAPEEVLVSARPLHVLVVDEVLMNRDIASLLLCTAGHTVTCVDTGEDAVAAVSDTDFDVVLMDVRMAGMDGLEATRRIRALGGKRGAVPIVALTAHAFAEQMEECRKAGMDGHLAKPFDSTSLQTAVLQAAGAGRLHRDSLRSLSVSPPPTTGLIGAALQAFDRNAFDRTAGCLAPDTVATYLRTISKSGEALLLGLRGDHDLVQAGDALAEAAHTLSGSAGMFGFERLAGLGRRFERSIQAGEPDAAALAQALSAAIEAALEVIADYMVQPAEA